MSAAAPVQTPPGLRQQHATTLQQIRAVRLAAVDMLAAGVAHEINNPLAFVSANVALLGQGLALCARAFRGEPLSAQEQEDLKFILEEGESIAAETADGCARIGQVVRRLAAFTDTGGMQPADLKRIVADVARVVEAGLERRIRFHSELADVPQIQANPARLAHAVFALLEHARGVAAAPSNPRPSIGLRLWAGELGKTVVLEVWDGGPALTPEQREIFEDPFKVTGPERTPALGLALARDIITQHGGVVTITQTPDGSNVRGVVFPVSG